MEKEQVRKLLTVLRINYPQSFKDYDRETSAMLLELWYGAFKNDDSDLVTKAVQSIVYNDAREFAPNIGQVKNKMLEIAMPTSPDEADNAWDEVRKVLKALPSDNPRDCEEYIKKLPENISRIYSADELVDMAFRRTTAELIQYEKPRFLKVYKEIQEHHRDKILIEGTSSLKIGYKGEKLLK